MPTSPPILLCTLNAKFIHASLGLRCLLANLGDLRAQASLHEFTIKRSVDEIVATLLAALPPAAESAAGQRPIVGFGVYLWNVRQTTAVVRALRQARPDLWLVLGGPEVSFETAQQAISPLADFIITGWGEVSFPALCRQLMAGRPPAQRLICGLQPPLAQLALPDHEYSDADLQQRVVYLETSRGCPFKCAFCLSALDKTAWPFATARITAMLERLYARGLRRFKFVDRTFNLNIAHALAILDFFLARCDDSTKEAPFFLHFEVIPDHLPEPLRAAIRRFPPGTLQLEIGIQTLTDSVQTLIQRRQDTPRSLGNLRWLMQESHAHLHTDLIFGLPGETLESFAASFDQLYRLGPHEIQLGLLKRLRGTPIIALTEAFGLQFSPDPPYLIAATDRIDATAMRRVTHMAGFWDRIANSGRFASTLSHLLSGPSPFFAFLALSDWLAAHPSATGHGQEGLVDALFDYCQEHGDPRQGPALLLANYLASGARGCPQRLRGQLPYRPPAAGNTDATTGRRQMRHQQARKIEEN